jgi:hypothetical protein
MGNIGRRGRDVVALCADESGFVSADVRRLRDRYSLVNVKLDSA